MKSPNLDSYQICHKVRSPYVHASKLYGKFCLMSLYVCFFTIVLLQAKPTHAQIIDICNDGTVTAYVAGAYYQTLTNSAIVIGWVEIKPGDCARVTRNLIPSGWSVGSLQRFYFGIQIQNGKGEWGMYTYKPFDNRNSQLRPTDQKFCVDPDTHFKKSGKMSALLNCSGDEQLAEFNGYITGKGETINTYEITIRPTQTSQIYPYKDATAMQQPQNREKTETEYSASANEEAARATAAEKKHFENEVPNIVTYLIKAAQNKFDSLKGQSVVDPESRQYSSGWNSKLVLPSLSSYENDAKIWANNEGVMHEITYKFNRDIQRHDLLYFNRIKDLIDQSIPKNWIRETLHSGENIYSSNVKDIYYYWCDPTANGISILLHCDKNRTFKYNVIKAERTICDITK